MDTTEARKRAREALERAEKATGGPYVVACDEFKLYEEMTSEVGIALSRGGLNLWYLRAPDEEMPVFPALTGNGPTSEANARFFAAARADVPALAAAVLALADRVDAAEREAAREDAARWRTVAGTLAGALKWTEATLRTILINKPVRDCDEVIVHAKSALAAFDEAEKS